MTSIVILTIGLFSLVLAPYSFVRTGRWSAAAYRRWVVGAVLVYAVLLTLVLTRFGHA